MFEKYLYKTVTMFDTGNDSEVAKRIFDKYEVPYYIRYDRGVAIFLVPFWRYKEARAVSSIANLELNIEVLFKKLEVKTNES